MGKENACIFRKERALKLCRWLAKRRLGNIKLSADFFKENLSCHLNWVPVALIAMCPSYSLNETVWAQYLLKLLFTR